MVDEEVVLTKELLDIAYFVKEKTLCSLSNAISVMLPKGLKASHKSNVKKKELDYLKLTEDINSSLNKCNSKAQIDIVNFIEENTIVKKNEANLISASFLK